MKIVFSGGGTGGHVYPALTVVELLMQAGAGAEGLPSLAAGDVLWIGSRGGMEEELVRHAGLEFVGLAAGGLRGLGPLVQARNLARILGSVGRARALLADFQPDVVLVTGGYACISVTLAARQKSMPVVIYLPDIVPGLAIRFLSRFAARVLVSSEESYRFFRREKVAVTGYPVRPEIYALEQAQARRALDLEAEGQVLLVFGGSRGARSINRALTAGLRELLPLCQILHITGRLDANWVAATARSLPAELQARYHPLAYLHEMPQALAAADLAVARAGAATMGEFPATALPAILVPYPHSGQHQEHNARHLAQNGAAQILADAELEKELVPTVVEMLQDGPRLAAMRDAARALARPDAAQEIARQLWLVARQAAQRKTRTGS